MYARGVVLGLLLAASSLLALAPAYACTCKPLTREQAIGMADAVFEGKVLRVRREAGKIYADIEHGRVIKGSLPRIVEVGTPESSAACGYPFKSGQLVTVAARFAQHQFTATACLMYAVSGSR